jgi:hypothetical protein
MVFRLACIAGSASATLALALAISACGEDTLFAEPGAGGGGATASSTQSTGGGAGGSTSTGGTAGNGGGCTPGATMDCYSGPPRTEGVGNCTAGVVICQPDGTFGPCTGEVVPAAEQCATLADEDCNGVSESCTPGQPVWAKQFSDPNPSGWTGGEGLGIAADLMGNVIVAGRAEGNIDFGGGPLTGFGAIDAVVAKLDPAGNHLWSKRFGSSGGDVGRDVAVGPGGVVWLTGDAFGTIDFGGDPLAGGIFLTKLDPQGAHLWSATFGLGYGVALAVDAAGAVIVTGYFQDQLDFGGGLLYSAGSNDVFVAKLDAQGAHLWSKRFGDASNQAALDVAVDASGNVILAASYDGAPDFGGGPLALTRSGLALVKLAPHGTHLASTGFGGGSNYVSPVVIAADPAGNVALAGGLYGTMSLGGAPLVSAGLGDVFAGKLTASGGHLWSARYGDGASQNATALATDAGGNALVCGGLTGSANFGGTNLASAGLDDVFVAKLSAGGSHVFSSRAGDAQSQLCWAVAADPTGHMLATGRFFGTLDFGTITPLVANMNSHDIFVVKLQP